MHKIGALSVHIQANLMRELIFFLFFTSYIVYRDNIWYNTSMKNSYPEFTKKRPKGTIVKKVRDTYYVYYATSEKIEGMKYPRQVIKGLAGKVDENGFHELSKTYVNKENVIIRECGFTNYMLMFKEVFANDKYLKIKKNERNNIYCSFIVHFSPNSYLNDDRKIKIYTFDEITNKFELSIQHQITSIEKILGKGIKELDSLKSICYVKFGNKIFHSKLTKEQLRILEELGVDENEINK